MSEFTYYDRLGLPRDASQDEIRHAYRQLVMRFHPDTNVNKGETEFFIDIQDAYEHLSSLKEKSTYDQQLQPEPDIASPLVVHTEYSQPSLVRLSEPQLLYVLMDLHVHPETRFLVSSLPLNLSLVVDCSTSMRGLRLDTVKLTAIEILRQLKPNDIFSLIKFNDRAELLIPPGNIREIKSAEMKVQLLQAGGGTEIYTGLQMGFSQVEAFRSQQHTNHIILITDGRTYGDELSCETLADRCAALGIGISVMGIGSQWNDKFLDLITSKTGGICRFIPDGGDIRTYLLEEISRLGSSMTEQISFTYQASHEVQLANAYRIQPELSPVAPASPIVLGYLPGRATMSIIFELIIREVPKFINQFTLLNGFLNVDIPRHTVKTKFVERIRFERNINSDPARQAPPGAIMDAVSLISLLQMQERARDEMSKGEIDRAARHMENLATQLLRHGKETLADSVLSEVAYLRHNQSFSEEGEKRIKYGTRSLLLPARVDKEGL
jgi:Ca-activated chloride channel family protein